MDPAIQLYKYTAAMLRSQVLTENLQGRWASVAGNLTEAGSSQPRGDEEATPKGPVRRFSQNPRCELPGSLLTRRPTGIVGGLRLAGNETIARRIAGWLVRSSPHADCLHCSRSV
jgi:hypothetical protein